MSKMMSAENMLSTFPKILEQDAHLYALASGVATELHGLYNDNNLLGIYTRIDELDEDLLDILAYDFKVDWWDSNYTLEEKRATFKAHWQVHRTLGTPGSVKAAVSAIFETAEVIEWWQYNGNPYRFKLLIDTGTVIPDYDKLQSVIERARFYKNLRSILEKIEFSTSKSVQLYSGIALQLGGVLTLTVEEFIPSESKNYFIDELGNLLTDETGRLLYE